MNNKYILLAFAVLFLMPTALAQYQSSTDEQYNMYNIHRFGSTVADGETQLINIRTLGVELGQTDKITVNYVESQNPIVRVLIMPFDGVGDADTYINISCSHSGFTHTIIPSLNGLVSWSEGDGYLEDMIELFPTSDGQTLSTIDEETAITYSESCSITAVGEDIMFLVQEIQSKQNFYEYVMATPTDATSDLLADVYDSLMSGYILLNIFLMVAGFFLFLFLAVFIWKTYEYIIKRIKRYRI